MPLVPFSGPTQGLARTIAVTEGTYTVCPDPAQPHCTCPDHADTGHKCKHIYAVEYVVRREQNADGSVSGHGDGRR